MLWALTSTCLTFNGDMLDVRRRSTAICWLINSDLSGAAEEEEGLQGVFKRLRRNRHQLEKGLQMAQRGPSLK
jgi:hypothetical protein